MKKYKLIKIYPGSPEVGTIARRYQQSAVQFIDINAKVFYSSESPSIIENNPEFWQEIVEKDYEILAFKEVSGQISILQSNGKYYDKNGTKFDPCGYFCGNTLEEEIKDGATIHSILRLSDGKVFTVGDRIDGGCGSNQEIVQITEDWIYYRSNIKGCQIYTYKLKDIKHSKEVLFTTEDGVDIFDPRQKVFSVSECDFKLQDHQDYGWIMTRNIERKYHHFSTKEKAEEYILMNKPCLSINDIYSLDKGKYWLSSIKELVKSKL